MSKLRIVRQSKNLNPKRFKEHNNQSPRRIGEFFLMISIAFARALKNQVEEGAR